MTSWCWLPSLLVLLLFYMQEATGTGRMLIPPQRSSLWRDPVHKRNPLVVKNHQDHTLNCGGLWKQKQNDGRCGVCGDPWNLPRPRPNEAGGTYGRGIIGRTFYPTDRFIPVKIQVLASIEGYFEFKLCPNNNVKKIVTQQCLDKNPLKIYSNDRWTAYGTRYYPTLAPNKPGNISLALEIPPGITCTQCVLQWKWHGGNNWGRCKNGTSATGCGPQVEFYNCADISILSNSVPVTGRRQLGRPSLSNAIRNNMLVSNAVVSLARQNNPTPTKLFTPNEIVMSNALRKELQSLSLPNTKSSAILNGVLSRPSTSTRAAMPTGVSGGTQAPSNLIKAPSNPMPNNPISPLLASVLGRGNGRGFGSPMIGLPNMLKNNLMASQSSGMTTAEYLAARALATTLLGQNSVNQNIPTTPTSGTSNTLENLLLAMALNPNRNAADYSKLAMLAPLLRRQMSPDKVQTSRINDTTMTRPVQNGSVATNVITTTQTQPAVVPTETSNYLQQFLISQLFPSLGRAGLAGEFGLNLPGIMISRSRSGGEEGSQAGRTTSGRGGEEASEGGSRSGSSMLGGNFGMSQQLQLLASLLGGNRHGIAERQFPSSPFAASVPGIFGSLGLGALLSGTSGRPQQMSLTPELILLSSMIGRNRRGGGEGSEGGGESRLFGSLFGRGGGGGERSEGRSAGGNMAGMSPMLALMLQQNLGMGLGGKMQRPAQSPLSPGMGLAPMVFGGKSRPLLSTALGGQKPVGLNTPFSMPLFGVNKAFSQIGGQNRDPLMSLMRPRISDSSLMSPGVSMLDLYRLFGFGGRRGTRRID